MTTLYLDRKGAALDVDAGSLTVRLGGAVATRVPLIPLERVVLRGDVVLSTRVLAELWRRDVGLLLLSGRHSEPTARLVGRPHDDVALRLAQYQRATDTEACRATAREIVGAKLAAEARLLARALELRPDRRKPLIDAIEILEKLQARIADAKERLDRDTLTGLEGAGAAAHFRAYSTLFPESLEFARRRTPSTSACHSGTRCFTTRPCAKFKSSVSTLYSASYMPQNAGVSRWPAISSSHCDRMSTNGSGGVLPSGCCAASIFHAKRAVPA